MAQELEQPLVSVPRKESGHLLVLSLLLNGVSLCGWMVFILLDRTTPKGENSVLAGGNRVVVEGIGSSSASHWARKAAAEAENASAIYCSGHGRAFVDTVEIDEGTGRALCECNDCFTGKDCSQKTPDCVVDANSGDPLFLEPYWELNAEAGAVVIPPSYRMSYVADPSSPSSSSITRQLERQIRQIHAFVGNAVTEGRYIVIGTGSTELINAAISSLAPPRNSSSAAALVVSRAPYYGTYRDQTKFFSSTQYKWAGDPAKAAGELGKINSSLIEILASPNNPDTTMREAILSNGHAVYDRAYYWPHFSPITQPAQDDVMLFTLSKLTGHAGSRLGWAIVKDREVYSRMHDYVSYNTLGVSHDTQLRASQLIKAVLAGYAAKSPASAASPEVYAQEQHLFHFTHAVMKSRWQRMQQAFQGSNRFSLQQVEPRPCLFFKAVTMPSPAYAWVRCKEAGADCYQVLKEAGILGRAGNSFGADDGHTRLSLLRRNDDFDNLMDRLTALLRQHKV